MYLAAKSQVRSLNEDIWQDGVYIVINLDVYSFCFLEDSSLKNQ